MGGCFRSSELKVQLLSQLIKIYQYSELLSVSEAHRQQLQSLTQILIFGRNKTRRQTQGLKPALIHHLLAQEQQEAPYLVLPGPLVVCGFNIVSRLNRQEIQGTNTVLVKRPYNDNLSKVLRTNQNIVEHSHKSIVFFLTQ